MDKLKPIFSGCIGFVLGILLTILIKKFSSFAISKELDFVSIMSLLITTVFAIYISVVLSKREKVDEAKKIDMLV